MNGQFLLTHFERISDAPDAVPRLRQFILDLAVRGRLEEQDPREEPASQLLARIQAAQARLKGETDVKKGFPRIVSQDEVLFGVPSSWRWVRLGDRLELFNGRAFKPTDWLPKGLPIVRIQNLNKESASFNYCDELAVEPRHIINSGSFLISWSGTPGTSFGAFIWQRGKAALNQHIFSCFQRGEAYFDRFLQLAINGRLDEMIAKAHGGVGLQHITKGKLENLSLPVPPLSEQRRIVAKVDELMALCDRLEKAQKERRNQRDRLASAAIHLLGNGGNAEAFHDHARFYLSHLPRLTTLIEHMQQLRQTIVDLAIQGRLVHQNINDEPALELLKRIQERARLTKNGIIQWVRPKSAVQTEKTPSAIPGGWEWVRIGDLLLGDSQNGYSRKPDDAVDGIPILRISAGTVRKDRVVAEEEHKLIGGVSAKQREQYELQPGDLLACRFNGNRSFVGRLSLFLGYLGIKPIYPDKLIRLRLLPGLALPKLVRYFAESSAVRQDIEGYCATTVGNWGISASNLKEVKIPLPPLPEQHRIVAKVDELMVLCDKLEAQLATAQSEARRLLDVVLHEALNDSL